MTFATRFLDDVEDDAAATSMMKKGEEA